ncbi:extensin family protein [Sagittula sp. M10.9X]|uniref:Extensin family protein n=2 Tax=Sagittula salina TaxID=2820268 RepID=A0A940S0N0_9RHOB|nr:extensin family protein [Sagittula salina]MBP0483258.1 extensin family protein [Sagittula salina]
MFLAASCGGARDTMDASLKAVRARFAGQGSVCGDPALIGERIGAVEANGICGIENAVLLRAVDGVALSTPATLNCGTAKALKTWVNTAARPAVGRRGGGVGELKVAASYACRTRNSQRGAKVSEHGKGNAIDIAAVRLMDGTELSVLHHWHDRKNGPTLKRMHKAACGTFGTTLGPGSDGFHEDHVHYDIARYRGGPYCK